MKQIPIIEYSNTSVTTPITQLDQVNNYNPLTFSRWKFSMALVRSLCSSYLNVREFYYEVILLFFNGFLFIDFSNSNLRLNSDRIERLRDFSKTSRIGEIGQAVTWLYLMENGYPIINDFHFFCNKIGIRIPKRVSTPDFIAQRQDLSTNLCLSESKGKIATSKSSIKSKLSKGLKQCNNGANLINNHRNFQVTKQIATCAQFSTNLDISDSTLFFCDPIDNQIENSFSDILFKIHYASWFYLIADFQNVDNLVENRSIIFNESNFTLREIDGQSYWITNIYNRNLRILEEIFLSRNLSEASRFRRYEDIKIGIAVDVIEQLKNRNTIYSKYVFKAITGKDFEIFSDGTLICDIALDELKSPNS